MAGIWSRYTYNFAYWTAAVSIFGASLGTRSGGSSYVGYEYVAGYGRDVHYLYGNNAQPSTSTHVYESDT